MLHLTTGNALSLNIKASAAITFTTVSAKTYFLISLLTGEAIKNWDRVGSKSFGVDPTKMNGIFMRTVLLEEILESDPSWSCRVAI